MRSRWLLAYLSLNRLFNGILSCSWCFFVQIQLISQKFNSCVTDGRTDRRTDRRTDGRTDIPSYRDARTHLKTKQVEQSSDNRCVLWLTARVLVFELYFKWHTFLFLMLFCSILLISQKFNSCVTDGPTDGRTDRRTDRRTDTPSHRDTRTHLKIRGQ